MLLLYSNQINFTIKNILLSKMFAKIRPNIKSFAEEELHLTSILPELFCFPDIFTKFTRI